jgi:hypothetical protein
MERPSRVAVTVLVLLAAAAACPAPRPAPPASDPAAPVIGIEELARLDLLPRLKPSVKVGLVSSYDRSGGNDDGFSGKDSFIRKEPGGLVLADLEGPGVLYRIHTPTPTNDIVEFYFDGEASARLSLKVIELFDGTRPPFVAPVAVYGAGGYTSYVPLTFRRSCKIVLKAESFQFYDINYAVFPEDVEVETYADPPSPDFMAKIGHAAELMKRSGTDLSGVLGSGPACRPAARPFSIRARSRAGS